jgi:hypothetical protein
MLPAPTPVMPIAKAMKKPARISTTNYNTTYSTEIEWIIGQNSFFSV